MDHIPGPIIAAVMPKPASRMGVSEIPDTTNTHSSAIAIVNPAIGVKKPESRGMAAKAARTYGKLFAAVLLSAR